MTSSPLPVFLAITQPKVEILASNFVHLLLIYSFILCIPLFRKFYKWFHFTGIHRHFTDIFDNIRILNFWDQNKCIRKTRDSHFLIEFNFVSSGALHFRFTSNPYLGDGALYANPPQASDELSISLAYCRLQHDTWLFSNDFPYFASKIFKGNPWEEKENAHDDSYHQSKKVL